MVAIAGTVGPSRRRRSNHFFSDTGLHSNEQWTVRIGVDLDLLASVVVDSCQTVPPRVG